MNPKNQHGAHSVSDGFGAEGMLTPYDVSRGIARWRMRLAQATSSAACEALLMQLEEEPEAVRAQLLPLIQEKSLQMATSAATPGENGEEDITLLAPPLNWVPQAVRQVLSATERVGDAIPGATGLVPLGYLRDGGEVLHDYRVVIRDQFKGNRTALFAQSGKGKTNLVKVILFWILFNSTYGKLVFDYKGEYVPWTQNERGERVPGLCEHPLARERVVLYTTKQRHLQDEALNAQVSVRPLKFHLRSILPRDFALFWPNLTKAQQEFLYTYDEDATVYETVLGEEAEWRKLGAWFGQAASRATVEDDEDQAGLDAAGVRVVRNVRRKLQAAATRSYIAEANSAVSVTQLSDGRYELHTPYRKPFVEALKSAIPREHRSYNQETKAWTVSARYFDAVRELIEHTYGAIGDLDSLSHIGRDLAAGKLVVVDLSGIASEPDRDLVATLVTRRQFEYNLERIDLEEGPEGRVPFVVFFEEAQNLLGAAKVRESKNSIFIRTFKEGRALAIGTTSITQQPGALSEDLTSQIAYYVVQHLRARKDIRDLVAMDPALEGAESDIARRIPGNALYVDNDRGFPLPLKIDKFDTAFVEAVRAAYEALATGDV